jgi:hypothetical protein
LLLLNKEIKFNYISYRNKYAARWQWLTSVILAPQVAEIRKIAVRSQPGQIVHETHLKKTITKKDW